MNKVTVSLTGETPLATQFVFSVALENSGSERVECFWILPIVHSVCVCVCQGNLYITLQYSVSITVLVPDRGSWF